MNALFDEQNNVVAEHAKDTIIPDVAHEIITVHHESVTIEPLEEIIQLVGGSVHGNPRQIVTEGKNV